ncbi:MAG: DUF5615 family PIN-like protein [Alphaproteobacteria bacterium]|nr:DUF5615 family PIN-like protein [Alphaproteobacteria bacterium]MBV8412335.1 DUF5615 family PIN-like protein [Alphaproteobacteria bacterium]
MIARLRADGLDVISIAETQPGARDDAILETARAEGRILITEDRDFGELLIRQCLLAAGVILLELDRLSGEAEAAH